MRKLCFSDRPLCYETERYISGGERLLHGRMRRMKQASLVVYCSGSAVFSPSLFFRACRKNRTRRLGGCCTHRSCVKCYPEDKSINYVCCVRGTYAAYLVAFLRTSWWAVLARAAGKLLLWMAPLMERFSALRKTQWRCPRAEAGT